MIRKDFIRTLILENNTKVLTENKYIKELLLKVYKSSVILPPC